MNEWMHEWKEGNVLFNNTLNTFYLQLYAVRNEMNEWMLKWMHKWMNEWMNEW